MKIKRDTKKEIVDKAAELFSASGYHVGINKIIAESGVAKMTCYTHFPAKADLVCAVIEASYAELRKRMRYINENETLRPSEQADCIFDLLGKTLGNPKHIAALIPRAIVELPADHPGYCVALYCEERIFDAIHAACAKAGCNNLTTARQIYMIIAGKSMLHSLFGDRLCIDAVRTATNQFVSGPAKNSSTQPAVLLGLASVSDTSSSGPVTS